MRRTTSPPRWSRPRIGGLSFASVPRPGAPFSRRRRPGRPPWRRPPAGPGAGDDVDLVDLDLALQPRRREPGGEPAPELLGHRLHVGLGEVQLLAALPGGEGQPL